MSEQQNEQLHPMKWHKFLIYFSLWAGAVLNGFTSLTYFTGSLYGGNTDMVYRVFGGLKTLDMAMGCACIAVAVYQIVTRFALAGLKAKGPKMLLASYAINLGVSLLYPLLVVSIIPIKISFGELVGTQGIASIVTSAIMIVANKVYYDKRRDMFVN